MPDVEVESKARTAVACCTPLDSVSMTFDQAEEAAAMFKALADPARIRIVNLLANSQGAACVCDITPLVELSQPTVSFHLKKLLTAGIVERTQRGKWAYYALRPGVLSEIAEAIDLNRSRS
ncbi:MAG: winged helix-turn-helix transcriptional regulator [Acidimicrobiia bacterium]|nr:winged helix-turn-helix transcriptional regulator [Acidimicrobiia bacterium]